MTKEEMLEKLEKANDILNEVKSTLEEVKDQIPVNYCEKDMKFYRKEIKYAIFHGVGSLALDIRHAKTILENLREA